MKLFILGGLITVLVVLLATGASGEPNGKNSTITLKTTNTAVLNEQVNAKTIGQLIQDIEALPDNDVYVYLNSPGGSVTAGASFISYMGAADKNITCIADFAASMAFGILQSCTTRVGLSHSILMQHNASFGLNAAPAPHQMSLIGLINKQVGELEVNQSSRIGMPLEEFRKKVRDDFWVYGYEAKELNVVDKIGLVSCSKKLLNTRTTKTVKSFFGSMSLQFSGCPLLSYPTAIGKSKRKFTPFNTLDAGQIKLINRIQ